MKLSRSFIFDLNNQYNMVSFLRKVIEKTTEVIEII